MLNIARVLALPALLAANTIYLTGDGSQDGLQVVVTGQSGSVVKKTKTTSEIQALIDAAANSGSSALVAEAVAIRSEFAAADASGLQAAKDYTDGKDAATRSDFAAADTAIRTDFAQGDADTLAAAKLYSDNQLQAEKTNILNTTDSKIATAIGSLDLSNTALFVADIAARDALTLTKSSFVLVGDATGDATVGAGAALYFYNLGDDTFSKVAEYEGMNFLDLNQPLLSKLGEQDGLLTFNGQLVATVQHTGSEW